MISTGMIHGSAVHITDGILLGGTVGGDGTILGIMVMPTMDGLVGTTGMILTTIAGMAGALPIIGAGMADGTIIVPSMYPLIEFLLVIHAQRRSTTVEPAQVTVAYLRGLLAHAIGATVQSQAITLQIM